MLKDEELFQLKRNSREYFLIKNKIIKKIYFITYFIEYFFILYQCNVFKIIKVHKKKN